MSRRVPGKRVGRRHYVHRSAVGQSRIPSELVEAAAEHLPPGWDYVVVRWDAGTGEVAFIRSPDWDEAPEPTVGDLVAVRADGTVRSRRVSPDRAQIYHHKWMFVAENYAGFDVEESRARSEAWKRLDPDRSRIGWKAYWEAKVVPLFTEEAPDKLK